jgi:uncharacterized protein
MAGSGKVKRIRNNGGVNIAPCKMDGSILGEWRSALAREVKNDGIDQKVDQLLGQKYGLMKKMFSLASALQGRKSTILEISLNE